MTSNCVVHSRQFRSKFQCYLNKLRQTGESISLIYQLPKQCCICKDPEKMNSKLINTENEQTIFDSIKSIYQQLKETTSTTTKTVHRTKPIAISLSFQSTSTVGRFIGKKGANLKAFEQQNHVQIVIVNYATKSKFREAPSTKSRFNRNMQVLLIPISTSPTTSINVDSLTEQLKLKWQLAIDEQKPHVEKFMKAMAQRVKRRQERRQQHENVPSSINSLPYVDGDTRQDIAFPKFIHMKQKQVKQKRYHRHSEPIATQHSSWSLEGHRCGATCAPEDKQQIPPASQYSKKQTKMKEKQRLLQEQLEEDSDSSI